MPYHVCNKHSIAFPNCNQFVGYWNMAHEGEARPGKQEVEREEVPEGVTPHERKQQKPKGQRTETPQGGEGELISNDFQQLSEEPPENVVERAKLFLKLYNIPEKFSTYCLNLLRAYPQAQGDPNMFANLLQNALLTSPAGKQHQSKLGMIVSGVFGLGQGGDMGSMPTPFFGSGQQQPFIGQQSFAPSTPAWGYPQFPAGGGGYYPPYQQGEGRHSKSQQLRQQMEEERNQHQETMSNLQSQIDSTRQELESFKETFRK